MLELKSQANKADMLQLNSESRLSMSGIEKHRLRILVSSRPNEVSKVRRGCVRTLILDKMPESFVYGSQMIFIDGLDKKQIAWALKESLNKSSVLVFLGGALLHDLGCENADDNSAQRSDLAAVFHIRCLPSIVRYEESKLLVEEVLIE